MKREIEYGYFVDNPVFHVTFQESFVIFALVLATNKNNKNSDMPMEILETLG